MRHKMIAVCMAVVMVVLGWVVAKPADAICDVAGVRVVHAETTPMALGATTSIFWLAANAVAPTVYFVFSTTNQMFINHLNAAHAANLQLRVQGDAAACPGAGTLRAGGHVLRVFRDTFN